MDWQPHEDEMLFNAGKAGGEYLDELGVTALARLSKAQFIVFLRCVFGRYGELQPQYKERWKQLADEENEIPFL